MTVDDARRITQENLKGPVIEPYLQKIYGKIQEAAKRGNNCITNPLEFSKMRGLDTRIEQAVYDQLRKDGFKVEYHEGDHRDPRECSYTEVSW